MTDTHPAAPSRNGQCCLRQHANATAPWSCPCECHLPDAAPSVDAPQCEATRNDSQCIYPPGHQGFHVSSRDEWTDAAPSTAQDRARCMCLYAADQDIKVATLTRERDEWKKSAVHDAKLVAVQARELETLRDECRHHVTLASATSASGNMPDTTTVPSERWLVLNRELETARAEAKVRSGEYRDQLNELIGQLDTERGRLAEVERRLGAQDAVVTTGKAFLAAYDRKTQEHFEDIHDRVYVLGEADGPEAGAFREALDALAQGRQSFGESEMVVELRHKAANALQCIRGGNLTMAEAWLVQALDLAAQSEEEGRQQQ